VVRVGFPLFATAGNVYVSGLSVVRINAGIPHGECVWHFWPSRVFSSLVPPPPPILLHSLSLPLHPKGLPRLFPLHSLHSL
jgi:hypothetical protein